MSVKRLYRFCRTFDKILITCCLRQANLYSGTSTLLHAHVLDSAHVLICLDLSVAFGWWPLLSVACRDSPPWINLRSWYCSVVRLCLCLPMLYSLCTGPPQQPTVFPDLTVFMIIIPCVPAPSFHLSHLPSFLPSSLSSSESCGAGVYPSCHRARNRVHPGQATSL